MPEPLTDTPGAVLRKRMEQAGATQADLSRVLGKSQAWISTYLFRDPVTTLRRLWVKHPELLERLAQELGWELSGLLRLANIPQGLDRALERVAIVPELIDLPIYDAGTGPAWENGEGERAQFMLPNMSGLERDRLFFLRVHGDSMKGFLNDGDMALVYRDPGAAQPGKAVAVWLADDGVVVKRLYSVTGEVLLLGNDNPDYERVFEAPLGSRIIGVVVKVIKDA